VTDTDRLHEASSRTFSIHFTATLSFFARKGYHRAAVNGASADLRASMGVPVMQIGIVGVRVTEGRVDMAVGLRLAARRPCLALVPVMFVVAVEMLVLQDLVDVLVLVALADVQPHAKSHEDTAGGEARRERLAERRDRRDGAEERRRREICARSRGAEVTQRTHEQHETDPVAEEPHDGGAERRCGSRELRAHDRRDGEVCGSRGAALQRGDEHGIAT